MLQEPAKGKLADMKELDDTGILDVPLKLFNPYRILVLKILYLHNYAEFRELKNDLKTTDGKLASHLRTLEENGYIEVHKEIIGKRPRTTYLLTERGIEEFDRFRTHLLRVVGNGFKS